MKLYGKYCEFSANGGRAVADVRHQTGSWSSEAKVAQVVTNVNVNGGATYGVIGVTGAITNQLHSAPWNPSTKAPQLCVT